MNPRLLKSLGAALALAALPLHAATIDELVAGLRAEIEKSLAEAKAAKPGAASSNAYEAERLISRIENGVARENFDEVDQSLNQLAVTRLSIEAKERVSLLQREIPKAAEERQKTFVAQVGAAIEKAGKACLTAKAESDLDPVLGELGALKKQRSDSGSGFSEPRQRLNARLEGAARFVNRWQDYLVQTARGYDATARNLLRELADPSGSSQYYPILSRTEIVARLGKEQDVTADDVVRGVKSLDELSKAIADLTRMSRESTNRTFGASESGALLNEINQIARAHAAFKAGNYGSALLTAAQGEGTGGLRSPESMRLKTLLVLEVLPRFLELPDNPQPQAGENPSEFLLRLAGESVAQNDWPRVARILDAYRLTAFGFRQPPVWISADLESCQQFVAGRNLEKAGRFVPAILAYQRAVKTSGKYSAQNAATDRLISMEKEHPDAFAEAGKEPQMRELLDALRPAATQRLSPLGTPIFDQ
ncbi:MAG: hypothetical protein JWL59_5030 [Chthoniobacteraceae bacterium]|nr:hypothetical protein [Chthoniobacteraceae bacterium]